MAQQVKLCAANLTTLVQSGNSRAERGEMILKLKAFLSDFHTCHSMHMCTHTEKNIRDFLADVVVHL